MADLSMSPHAGDTTHPYPSELPAAIQVARRMLAAFATVDYGNSGTVAQAHGALAESLRILLRAVDDVQPADETPTAYTPVGPGCGAPATACIEGYSPRHGLAHGSLDRAVYACTTHTAQARIEWLGDLLAYTASTTGARRCGEHFDYALGGGR